MKNRDHNQKSIIKRMGSGLLVGLLLLCITACGKGNSVVMVSIEGELSDIMADIYENADLDTETKEAMDGYVLDILTADNEEALLGAADVPYIEGVFSVPMISSIAYQCVLLRVEPNNVEEVKETLLTNADLNKWVCVSAETVLAESVGDLVLFIMGEENTASAVSVSFQALGS